MGLSLEDILRIAKNFKKKNIKNTISDNLDSKRVYDAIIEAEKGEVLLTYDPTSDKYPRIYYIKGKSHSEGGTMLDIPEGSFVFSNARELIIKNPDLLSMFDEKKPKTPAEIAKKYLFNESLSDLEDNNSDIFRKNASLNDIDNKVGKLALLAIIQELSKGNEKIPAFVNNYFMSKNVDPEKIYDSIKSKISGVENTEKEDINTNKAYYGIDVNNGFYGLYNANFNNFDNQATYGDNPITSANAKLPVNGVQIETKPQAATNFSYELKTDANTDSNASSSDKSRESKSDSYNYKRTIELEGGLSYLNKLKAAAGISQRLQNMQSNYSYFANNPINADTRSNPIVGNDRGDYSIAGTTYGSFRPYEQNANTNRGMAFRTYGVGNQYFGQTMYFEEGGEIPGNKSVQSNIDYEGSIRKVYDELKRRGVIDNSISFDEYKNKYRNQYERILNAYKVIITRGGGSLEDRQKIASYIAATGINSSFNSSEKKKWNKFANPDSSVAYRRLGFLNALKDITGEGIDDFTIYTNKPGDKAMEFVKKIQNKANEVLGNIATSEGNKYYLNVDGLIGEHTGFDMISDIEKYYEKEKPQDVKQPEIKDKETPKIAQYKNVGSPSYPEIKAPEFDEKAKEELANKLKELKSRNKINDTFFVQDVNNIMSAFANLVSVKKYMPVSFTYDVVVGRPVFYSPDRSIQASQQSANIAAKAASSVLPGGIAASFASGVSAQMSDNIADILAKTQASNVGIANQYNQLLASATNQANEARARQLEDIYNKTVIANQQYDNAKRDAMNKLVAAYNAALDNRAKKSIINMIHLYGSPYKVDEYGRIVFDENYKANIQPTKPKDKSLEFNNLLNYLKKIGIDKESERYIIQEYINRNPDVFDYFGEAANTASSINESNKDINNEIYAANNNEKNISDINVPINNINSTNTGISSATSNRNTYINQINSNFNNAENGYSKPINVNRSFVPSFDIYDFIEQFYSNKPFGNIKY